MGGSATLDPPYPSEIACGGGKWSTVCQAATVPAGYRGGFGSKPGLCPEDTVYFRSKRAMDSTWAVWGNMSITPAERIL